MPFPVNVSMVEPPRDGGIESSMTEVFSGLMAPMITKSIPDLQPVFAEFATCLKRAAEQS